MFAKINVTEIVVGHIGTLRSADTGKVSSPDWFLFFAIPVIVAAGLCYKQRFIDKDEANMLVQAYAILVGLLFNLLVLILTAISKEHGKNADIQHDIVATVKLRLLRETFANISYCVLLGILVALVVVATLLKNVQIHYVACFIAYAGSANFVLTLLMILKRVYRLFKEELEPS